MAIPPNVARAVIHGTMAGGEIFNTGFYMGDSSISSNESASEAAQALWSILIGTDGANALTYSAVNFWGATTKATGITVYDYPTGGPHATYVGDYTPDVPIVGNIAATCPNQACAVVTLRSGVSGRRNRGRMYIPATAPRLDGNGEFPAAASEGMADIWAGFFGSMKSVEPEGALIVSAVGSTARPITSVKFDTKVDIQRRRANRQAVEFSYSTDVAT